jgi:uncharacterized protein YndB with AHSA1/START domain
MPPIVSSIDIARAPEEVFAYVTDPATMNEWQPGVTSGRMDRTPTVVGAHCLTTRKIGGATREVVTEITEHAPPRRWADRGIAGPIRAAVSVTVDPLDEGTRSRVMIELDFEGHGIGKVLVPLLVRHQATRDMPSTMLRLKKRLEGAA